MASYAVVTSRGLSSETIMDREPGHANSAESIYIMQNAQPVKKLPTSARTRGGWPDKQYVKLSWGLPRSGKKVQLEIILLTCAASNESLCT
jgi:hypothetical protein